MSQTTLSCPTATALATPQPDIQPDILRVGPQAHPAPYCDGCVSLGTTYPSGDYGSRYDTTVELSVCPPGPHAPGRRHTLLLWMGTHPHSRGVLPAALNVTEHPYFTRCRSRAAAAGVPSD